MSPELPSEELKVDSNTGSLFKPSLLLFFSIALLSGAVLGYEIALTRVFAVLLRYQFAFLVVSLALCGLGLGGLLAHLRPKMTLEGAALGWGISAAASLALILRGVFPLIPQHYWVAALLVLVPFIAAGAFLSLVFGRYSQFAGRLYAFDLAGAAIAAAFSVALMQFVGAINACLFFAGLGAAAGALLAKKKEFPAIIALILLLCVPYNQQFKLWDVQPIPPVYVPYPDDPNAKPGLSLADRGVTQPLFTEMGAQKQEEPERLKELAQLKEAGKVKKDLKLPVTSIYDSRWNAFARTDVVSDIGDPQHQDSFMIYTNGNVPTNMLRWNGELLDLPRRVGEFPLSDWTFENSNLSGARVLSIGPGGGLDALLALRYGADAFEGAEINPSIVSLMKEKKYVDYNGGIYLNPKVNVQTAEGRAFVRESANKGKRYRLIFSALTKTATAGQGAALLESFIYTQDAFNDYLGALDNDGSLAIVGDARPLIARLTVTAMQHFIDAGETPAQAGQHIAVMYYDIPGPYTWSLLIKKRPFTAQEAQKMADSATRRKLLPFWIPGRASQDDSLHLNSLLSGTLSLDGFINGALRGTDDSPPLDLSPCPDDRPFVLDLAPSPWAIFTSSTSLTALLGLAVVGTILLAGGLMALGTRSGGVLPTFYFLALGVGFMLIEIPLIQKLVLPLGYPTLSLSVILFSLLLGGGGGALYSQSKEGNDLRQHALACALGVTIASILFGTLSGVFSSLLLPMPLVVRCVLAAILLLPLGFLLGTPFPTGLRLMTTGEKSVALAWALNGTASVVGSIIAAVMAKVFGYGAVLTLGAVIYGFAAAILWKNGD